MKKVLCILLPVIILIFTAGCDNGNNRNDSFPDDVILQSLGLSKADALKNMNVDEQNDCEADNNHDPNSAMLKKTQSYFDNSFKTSFYFYDDRLNDVVYKAAFDDYDKSIELLCGVTQYMKDKYGEPSTYSGLPNRVVDFLEKESSRIKDGQPFDLAEEWTPAQNIDIEDPRLEKKIRINIYTSTQQTSSTEQNQIVLSVRYARVINRNKK